LKLKIKIEKDILKGWKGILIYWVIGFIVLKIIGVNSLSLYLLMFVSVPIIHFTHEEDTMFYILVGILSAFLIYRIVGLVLGTNLPLVAVVSRSMLHDETTPVVHYKWLKENLGINRNIADSWPLAKGFDRGDLLIVIGTKLSDLKVGDVIVFDANQGYPVVHRIVKIEKNGFRTKGDHNPVEDPWIVTPDNIHGKAIFVIPKLGYFKIIVAEVWYSLVGR